MFQFPTGWNSTLLIQMILARCSSFNSQRDGILHVKNINPAQNSRFQFPTGWNSTQIYRGGKEQWISFNSQRDGILQNLYPYATAIALVSIPNGMEFYQFWSKREKSPFLVSIPNGMEFYAYTYNSSDQIDLVSIPNGMEFYPDGYFSNPATI